MFVPRVPLSFCQICFSLSPSLSSLYHVLCHPSFILCFFFSFAMSERFDWVDFVGLAESVGLGWVDFLGLH